jgi:hypothetical protein
MTTLPAFKLEIDADTDVDALVVLDTSLLDSADVLAETIRYVEVPAVDVREVQIRRGRARDDQAVDAGTATISLDAWSGDYDPDNAGGPYIYNGNQLLRIGMPLRISVTLDGTDYPLFTGALESTSTGYGWEPTVTWTCVDMLSRLGHAAFPPSDGFEREGDTTEDRIDWLLQYDPAFDDRTVSTTSRTLIGTKGGGTVLSNLEDVVRAEWGRVYADRDNTLRITAHADEYAHTVVIYVSDSRDSTGAPIYGSVYTETYPGMQPLEASDLTVEPGLEMVVNRAILTRADTTNEQPGEESTERVDVKFTGEDDTSVERYGQRTYDSPTLLADDDDAQEMADYLATRRSVPTPWLTSVTIPMNGYDDTALQTAAELDLGDWLHVERVTPDGRSMSWRVSAEGIDHTITTGGGWLLTVATAALDNAGLFGSAGWFTVDTSMLDGGDVLGAF